MKIYEAIGAMLEKRNTTRAKLAFDIGVTPQTVNAYINGVFRDGKKVHKSVKVDTAVEIAEALGYKLAFVPSDKVPNGAFVIDDRATDRDSRRKSKEA